MGITKSTIYNIIEASKARIQKEILEQIYLGAYETRSPKTLVIPELLDIEDTTTEG